MINTKYIVRFAGNSFLDDEFDVKEDAITYANEHLEEKPTVVGVELEYDDEGIVVGAGEEEIIFDSTNLNKEVPEESKRPDKTPEEVISELENVMSSWDMTPEEEAEWEAQMEKEEEDRKWGEACMYDADEFDGHENLTEALKPEVISEIKSKSKLLKDVDDQTIGALAQYYSDEFGHKLVKMPVDEFVEYIDDEETLGNIIFDLAWDANLKPLQIKRLAMADPKFMKTVVKIAKDSNVMTDDGMDVELPDSKFTEEDAYNWLLADCTDDEELYFDTIADIAKEYKKLGEDLSEDMIILDPFGVDFSEVTPMEVCRDEHRADCSDDFCKGPADWLRELAAELGIADEVEISEKTVEEPVVDETPVVEEPKTEVVVSAEVPADVATNVTPETPVTVEIPVEEPIKVEDEVKVDEVPEEVKANEEPNVPVQVEDEEPAKEISDCHVCPECGKEICECNEMLDKNPNTTVDEIEEVVADDSKTAEEKATIICEDSDSLDEGADDEAVKHQKVALKFKKDMIGENPLEEESHPQEAQPEVDMKAAFNKALEIAKKENKPVIYGYMGPDHHGESRYFEIEHVVCDDLAQCRDEVMKKYHPNGSVLVAYPDKDFAEEFDPRNCDLENKELFIEEQEMTDEEFAEAFKKGLEEKHCNK